MSERPQEAVEDDTGSYASGLPGFLGTIDEWIARIEAVMLAGGVILMAINTCVNVIARFVFGEGLFFSGEINRILIILITFAGIGYAARHGRHIRMSAVYDAFPAKGRKVLMIFIALFTSVVNSAMKIIRTLRPLAGKDRKSTRLNSSHVRISYAVFCLKKKKTIDQRLTV